MQFEVLVGDITYSITDDDVIAEGETTIWTIAVWSTGTMTLANDGVLFAERQGVVPQDDLEESHFIF